MSADTGPDLYANALAEVQRTYLDDDRPWVVGYSGGKDSTATLQLIWQALAALDASRLTKPVYVIAGDTLVETPVIIEYLASSLRRMGEAAQAQGLPISAHSVTPTVEDGFWVNLIGRGYPAPTARFRWCTERMKIKPANRFIRDRVAEHGEVIMVLGVRRQESATRGQLMNARAIKGTVLSRHNKLPNAFVYAPIRDWSLDDVWSYLLQVPSPWGNDNEELLTMYRRTSGDECPLVVDTSTPSCGSSRFGCWTCTVVTKDKAMEAMVDQGEEWLEPLLEVRDYLAHTQDPAVKAGVRRHVRRNGKVTRKDKGDLDDLFVRGPYELWFCKELLRKVLRAQRESQSLAPPGQQVELIRDADLQAIRRIWRDELGDWHDELPEIVEQETGARPSWAVDDGARFDAEDESILGDLCREADVPLGMLKALIDAERRLQGQRRRADIRKELYAALDAEWRSEAEVTAEVALREQARTE